jgi:hypothetical protein
MLFDLQTLLPAHSNLDWLEEPFTMEEINQVVADLPTDKSPGPDGFSNEFLKKMLAHNSP